MNGRSAAYLLALMTMLSAFAGCLEMPSFLTATDGEATALQNKDLADNAAAAWSPDAKLAGVTTFEASPLHAEEGMGLVPIDPAVGNGRALLWFYAYQTPEGAETRVFRVDADGRISVENTSMVPFGDLGDVEPVGAWSVDSDAAITAARADATFEKAASAENASIVSALGTHQGVTQWALMALSEKGLVVALVNAASGELIMVETIDFSEIEIPSVSYPGYGMDTSVHLEGEGSLDSSTMTMEFPFSYAGMGDPGLLEIEMGRRLPTDALAWHIEDAEGEVVADGYVGGLVNGRGTRTFDFEMPHPGDYVLVFAYESRAFVPLGEVGFAFVMDIGAEALNAVEDEA